jgi:hypothetical protein
MVVDNLDPLGIPFVPHETDAPPVIDPDAVLARPVTAQRLQSIAGRSGQVAQLRCLMELPQLTLRDPLNVPRRPPREPAMEQRLGVAIGERADHARRLYTDRVQNVKRSPELSPVGLEPLVSRSVRQKG